MHTDLNLTIRLDRRVLALQSHFSHVAQQRMRGLPVIHNGLQVQAVNFAVQTAAQAGVTACALGVLVTPWFMNLVRLPLDALTPEQAAQAGWFSLGQSGKREVGGRVFDFFGHCEGNAELGGLGVFEACSLFSPMFEFVDHAAAVATAGQVLQLLRMEEEPRVAAPARRGFLFGRRAAAQGGS